MVKMMILNIMLALAVIFLTYQLYQSHTDIAELNREQAVSAVRIAELEKQLAAVRVTQQQQVAGAMSQAQVAQHGQQRQMQPAQKIMVGDKSIEELAEEQIRKEQGSRDPDEPVN